MLPIPVVKIHPMPFAAVELPHGIRYYWSGEPDQPIVRECRTYTGPDAWEWRDEALVPPPHTRSTHAFLAAVGAHWLGHNRR